MTVDDIRQYRLTNQHLSQKGLQTPQDVVAWLGAVQAQDYPGAKWGLAQRMQNANDETIEQAFNKGEILRTHVMRPTWHFVTPKDIRWLLQLTKHRVKALMGHYNKKLELDDKLFAKTAKLFINALQNKKNLTRRELKAILSEQGIKTDVQRLAHIVMWAELDGIICSGPLKGKQFSYILMDEHIKKPKQISQEEALKELTKRYFTSHGPAQLKDFVWWSGLTTVDAKKGIEMNSFLYKEIIDGKTYWFPPFAKLTKQPSPTIYLLPNYDEYGVAYTDRSALIDDKHKFKQDSRGNSIFANSIFLDGKYVGNWKRIITKKEVIIEANFNPLTHQEREVFKSAAQQYGKFLQLPVKVKL